MIEQEPNIKVGILDCRRDVSGIFNGEFEFSGTTHIHGAFRVNCNSEILTVYGENGTEIVHGSEIFFRSLDGATFTLRDVIIGIQFHWERKEDQTFRGNLHLLACKNNFITAINEIPIEQYLASVISSEMSSEAPIEFLRAHAITSRSWLVAMLERKSMHAKTALSSLQSMESQDEIIRWYDREDHALFDVCADDHCQRYQGVSKIISKSAEEAVKDTKGIFLVYNNAICDARFHKACGGRTELYENTWENIPIPYLRSVSDSVQSYPSLSEEDDAHRWMVNSPNTFCNTTDNRILKQILPAFDQETQNFFRWKAEFAREELEKLIFKKSGIDFGTLLNLKPLERGQSGRIIRLKIQGKLRTVVIGKELEIRKWLSPTHLYSSAFIIDTPRDEKGIPIRFIFSGAGWGHGVGLCQIGAAVMAMKGYSASSILAHYFQNSFLQKIY